MRLPPSTILLTTWAMLAGCNDFDISVVTFTDTFDQSPFEKVDVLLVVDNSGSMGPYQEKLASDFGGFFDFFADGEVDWQLAVTHTDVGAFDFGEIRGPVVSPAVSDPDGLFAEVVNVGINGGGSEAGLMAANQVIRRSGTGFPRDDASMSVIFVSDEQDASPRSVSEYVNRYYELKGDRNRAAFNASALTVQELADCTPEQFQLSAPGTRYIEVARLTGGISANLCVDDFAQIVIDLALTTSTMQDTFFLGDRPQLSTLRVLVAGEEVACDAAVWRYDLVEREGVESPAIVFAADALPEPGADILVEYQRGTGKPEDFCGGTAP